MLCRTVVLLTSRVKLLMKGVAPGVCPVIVIVVLSASLALATWERTTNTAPTTINEHVFIEVNFFIVLLRKVPRGFQRRRLKSSKNFDDTQLFFGGCRMQMRREI